MPNVLYLRRLGLGICLRFGNLAPNVVHTDRARQLSTSPSWFLSISKSRSVGDHGLQAAKTAGNLLGGAGDNSNVIVDDLAATLESHRARNRASIIRRVAVSPPASETRKYRNAKKANKHLGLANQPLDKAAVNGRAKKNKPPSPLTDWPADSVQAHRLAKKTDPGLVRPSTCPKDDEILEYRGRPLGAYRKWDMKANSKSHMTRPWLLYRNQVGHDPYERLSHEIRAFEAYVRLTPAEEVAANHVFSAVSAALEPRYRSILMGSRSTGLATTTSDLDISVEFKPNDPAHDWEDWSVGDTSTRKKKTLAMLFLLEEIFSASEIFSSVQLIHARVPIVRAKHVATNLEVQLQVMASLELQHAFIKTYLEDLPSFRPLYVSLRFALEIRHLTTVREGGLGSYTLLMMIVVALKHADEQIASGDLGRRLLHVLAFWGSANLYDNGYSVHPLGQFAKKQGSKEEQLTTTDLPTYSDNAQRLGIEKTNRYDPQRPYLLCLQDPAKHDNDLGRNAYAIKHIQVTFLHIHENILKLMLKAGPSKDTQNISLLGPLVQANYEDFESHRSRVERFSTPERGSNLVYHSQQASKDAVERAEAYKKRHGYAHVGLNYTSLSSWFRKCRASVNKMKTGDKPQATSSLDGEACAERPIVGSTLTRVPKDEPKSSKDKIRYHVSHASAETFFMRRYVVK